MWTLWNRFNSLLYNKHSFLMIKNHGSKGLLKWLEKVWLLTVTKLGKKTRISLKDDNSRQTVAHPCNGRQIGQHEMNF